MLPWNLFSSYPTASITSISPLFGQPPYTHFSGSSQRAGQVPSAVHPANLARKRILPYLKACNPRVTMRADVYSFPPSASFLAVMRRIPLATSALVLVYHCSSLLPQPHIPLSHPSPISYVHLLVSGAPSTSNSSLQISLEGSGSSSNVDSQSNGL